MPSASRTWRACTPPSTTSIDAVDLAVTGTIPRALDGTFLRNGPNPMFAPKGRYHLFDGDGMVHGLTLGDGKASLPQPLGAQPWPQRRDRRWPVPLRRHGDVGLPVPRPRSAMPER